MDVWKEHILNMGIASGACATDDACGCSDDEVTASGTMGDCESLGASLEETSLGLGRLNWLLAPSLSGLPW